MTGVSGDALVEKNLLLLGSVLKIEKEKKKPNNTSATALVPPKAQTGNSTY